MDLKALQKEAHAIAKEHGWWDQERSFGDLIALVHSELSEALEAYREHGGVVNMFKYSDDTKWFWHDTSGHPVGVAAELADVVIRVADMAEWYGVDLASIFEALAAGDSERDMSMRTFGDWIATCHASFSLAFAVWEYGFDGASWQEYLSEGCHGVQRMAAHYCIDLDAAIEAKMEYNRTRSYRHGGKAL